MLWLEYQQPMCDLQVRRLLLWSTCKSNIVLTICSVQRHYNHSSTDPRELQFVGFRDLDKQKHLDTTRPTPSCLCCSTDEWAQCNAKTPPTISLTAIAIVSFNYYIRHFKFTKSDKVDIVIHLILDKSLFSLRCAS